MPVTAATLPLLGALLSGPASPTPPPTRPEDVASSLKEDREKLGRYRFRLQTRLAIDGDERLTKLEDVHLGPDGGIVREKTVRFDRRPVPAPLPYADPRRRSFEPLTEKEEDALFEESQALLNLYVTLPPARVAAWAARAREVSPDPDRGGRRKLHGRGLARPFDDVVAYLDPASGTVAEVEVKTTVTERLKDIAFLRVTFQTLPALRAGGEPTVAPKEAFLNMDRDRRRVVVDLVATDFRSWP